MQDEFKEVHKMSDKFKSQLISPNEIKKAIMQMEKAVAPMTPVFPIHAKPRTRLFVRSKARSPLACAMQASIWMAVPV